MASNYLGWKILQGNYSTAYVLETIYLSDPHAFLQMLFTGFVAGMDLIIGVILVFLFYALIAGRAFCSWVCPLNILSDIALYIRKNSNIGTEVTQYSHRARYYVLALGLIVSTFTGVAAFELINPITIVHRGLIFGLISGLYVAILIVAISLFVNRRGWCASLCPLGAFYSLINKVSIIKVFHDEHKCTDCGICFEVCPEEHVLKNIINIKDGFISSGECTNCGRCIEKCNDDALNFGINKLKYK